MLFQNARIARTVWRQYEKEIGRVQAEGRDADSVRLTSGSLHRFCDLQIPLLAHSWYPVLRILRLGLNRCTGGLPWNPYKS